MWEIWKKGFYAWEASTAKYAEEVLRSPLVLKPSGLMLSAAMKAKARNDQLAQKWWGSLGLPTKSDQERLLHAVNQLQSQLYDLEDQLHEMQRETS